MTKGIEEMLGIPHLDDILKADGVDYKKDDDVDDEEPEDTYPVEKVKEEFMQSLQNKLMTLEGTDHAKAMDVIYNETLDHSRNIMDLAFNVDDRSRRGLMEIGTSMYKNAIDAKNSKRDAQLKAMRLMLDQQKMELDDLRKRNAAAPVGATDIAPVGETGGVVVEDRNLLVRKLREQMAAEKKKD